MKNRYALIYLQLTDHPDCFCQTNVFETGLSNFHMIVVTELQMEFQKLKRQIVIYRDYKHFDNEKLRSDIESCSSEKV